MMRCTVLYRFVVFLSLFLAQLSISQAAYSAVALERNSARSTPEQVITSTRLSERLVPTTSTSIDENEALMLALQRFEARTTVDDFSSLSTFLAENPRSGWTPAVAVNLGLLYLHHGYFTSALAAFDQTWRTGGAATDPEAKAIVDRAIGEEAMLLASLGRFEELRQLFTNVGARPISGSATELYQSARESLTIFDKGPGHLLNCGPLALKSLLLALGRDPAEVRKLDFVNSGKRGTNLSQIAAYADQYKLAYRLVFRQPGQVIPARAIIHWKLGHYAAIIGRSNDRFQIMDPVAPASEMWITADALDAEASGYMLVPVDAIEGPWRAVSQQEASTVWGAGVTNGSRPGSAGDPPANSEKPCPLCGYNIAESSVAITLSDTPVGYDPPLGPSTKVRISYNQREASQPATFNFFNVGSKWTLSWLSYVIDDPTSAGTNVSRFLSGGGAFYYTGYQASTGRFAAQDTDGSVLTLIGSSPIRYERRLGDGSVEIYSTPDGSTSYPRKVFLTEVRDPQGNALQLSYDGQLRLTTLTDATGRQTLLSYTVPGKPLLVSKITDPFGRSAGLTYDGSGRLSSITDIIGLTSSFTYDANSLVNSLTTPYGTTTFSYTTPGASGPPRFVDVTDPLGFHEREEWLEPAPIPASDPSGTVPVGLPVSPINNFLQYRNSFHWDKVQYAAAGCTPTGGCDYSKARVSHFVHFGSNVKGTALESRKEPLENRVWFSHPGQTSATQTGTSSSPSASARVLDDGTTQIVSNTYDVGGFFKPTSVTDGVGRTTTYTYSNHIDLAAIAQTAVNGNLTTIAQFAYDTRHRPIIAVDAAGQVTKYTYNAKGQMLTSTDPFGHVTQYQYNTNGNLLAVINANGQTQASYTYDNANRIATATDSEGLVINYSYDAADRVTAVTYPDGTSERYSYDRLDLASFTNRINRTWRYTYDANGNKLSETDPLGNQTLFSYNGTGRVTSMTDPNGNVTSWTYDIQSRPTEKGYADTSKVLYTYETTTSRLKSVQDALGQTKQFTYNRDDRIASINYLSPINPTPNVVFTYDPYFPLLTTMTDGSGTTQYTYHPIGTNGALQLAQTTTPIAGATIAYGYDALGRIASRTVAGSGAETFQYDSLGRPASHSSDLGTFALDYLGQTAQITERALSGSTLKTTWAYLPNSGDRRLQKIENIGLASSQYSNFTFTTNSINSVKGIIQDSDISISLPTTSTQTATYNNLNQLTDLSGQAVTYDAVGNVLSDGARTYTWDAENRLVSISYPAQPGKLTTFSYDGLGRRYQMSSTSAGGGTPVGTSYIWCGDAICQARDGLGNPTRSYIAEGEYVPGVTPQRLFYGIDQLGSVRRVFASTTSAPAYDYDPYGNLLTDAASLTDVGYAGMWVNPDSGLNLTLYRVYDPAVGRWLSRDPLGENIAGGTNLYAYVGGSPVVRTDQLGLACNGAGCYTTPAEAAAARGGSYDRYYRLACAGGDAYACYARHIAANDNASGHLANWWLDRAIDDLEDDKSQCIDRDRLKRNIRKGLAERYANYLPQDANRRRWPTKQGVSQIHWDEFGGHGLPPNTFGGTPFGKNGPYTPFVDWCPNCR